MSRVRKIALGALVALLVAAPFIPRGGDPDDALTPSGEAEPAAPAGSVGRTELTPAMSQEIDRVVAAGRTLGRAAGTGSPEELARELVRCAEFTGQRYCLQVGWTDLAPSEAVARVSAAARTVAARGVPRESTGDLDALAALRRAAAMSPAVRAAVERRELTDAARSVAKVWLLRHEVQGVPLPSDFAASHPEARPAAKTKTFSDYPRRRAVLRGKHVREQHRSYWCGPTTLQMITWAWQDRRRSQGHWANKLGTTTEGSAISQMVRMVNRATGYDQERYAGPYITLDISDWSYKKWLLLQMRHTVDYRAPVVLHPILLKQYYPYLDDDASGHFQVGRGYDKNGKHPADIGYFEPWNQQRFDPSEPYIARVQWRAAYKSYRANRAHFQHNIGV